MASINILLAKGVDINQEIEARSTVLHIAAMYGYMEIAILLLEKGSDVNAKSIADRTPLHVAAYYGQKEMAMLLIKNRANVKEVDGEKFTALHFAVGGGHTEIAELLIKHGTDVNAVSKNNETALLFAADKGNKESVSLLLKAGADPTIQDAAGRTAADLAPKFFTPEAIFTMFKESIAYQDTNTTDHLITHFEHMLLLVAVDSNDTASISLLLDKGADVNAMDTEGYTSLYAAIDLNYVAVIELLLQNGANVNAVDKHGYTALHAAADIGNINIVNLLLQKGAEVNPVDKDRYTALMFAANRGYKEIVSLLLKAGADPTINDLYARTAASIKPELFTDKAILEIFKEAIDKGDQTAVENLDKSFPKFKEQILKMIEAKLKKGEVESKGTIALAVNMLHSGFFDPPGENSTPNKETYRSSVAISLGIGKIYNSISTPRRSRGKSFSQQLKEAGAETHGPEKLSSAHTR